MSESWKKKKKVHIGSKLEKQTTMLKLINV